VARETFLKRQKEMARQKRRQDKEARRRERKEDKEDKVRSGSTLDGEDPDIAGILPGPQPKLF
jgi:hypothetical protein